MKTTSLFFILIIFFVFNSCKKDKDMETPVPSPSSPTVYPDYWKLDTGNYWIYERYSIDSLGNATSESIYDSCYIAGDTIINSNTYYLKVWPVSGGMSGGYFRDSLHYVVDPYGKIWFSSQDTSIVRSDYQVLMPINDTVCSYTCRMTEMNVSVTVPSGTYLTDNFKTTYHMYPAYTAGGTIRYISKRYSENIGLVRETLPFYSLSSGYEERRLVRFHVN